MYPKIHGPTNYDEWFNNVAADGMVGATHAVEYGEFYQPFVGGINSSYPLCDSRFVQVHYKYLFEIQLMKF